MCLITSWLLEATAQAYNLYVHWAHWQTAAVPPSYRLLNLHHVLTDPARNLPDSDTQLVIGPHHVSAARNLSGKDGELMKGVQLRAAAAFCQINVGLRQQHLASPDLQS